MTLDNLVEADILSTCNAIGSDVNGVYEKSSDCVECLKDILRYLRKDSEDHAVLRFLGAIRLLQTDLLPLIKRYQQDKEIVDFAFRLLVALTNPAILLYNEDLPDDKISRNVYLQIISYLQAYKRAFFDVEIWKVLFEHLKNLLTMRPIERNEEENLLIERILTVVRNILHVPSDESVLYRTEDDLSPHDKVLWSLHESKIDALILYLASNEEEHQFCLHILEIVALMLREHTAEILASTNESRSELDKEKDLKVLFAARQREQNMKMKKIQNLCSSRFNGVFCVKNMKSLSDKDYIAHKLITDLDSVKFDSQKNVKRKPKNRVPAKDFSDTRRSTLDIRVFLKNLCSEFLKPYNKLMVSVKKELLRKNSDEHDDSYYLWALRYFMEFNRRFNFHLEFVTETISMQSFHFIQTEINNYSEMMLTDKRKAKFWSKRIQLGVSAYKELLETLKTMSHSKDDDVGNNADSIISNVFYVIEYRELLLSLLTSYDEVRFPLTYLAELVESTHLFLKMLETHSKKHSEIIVQKKARKIRKRKKKPAVLAEPINIEQQLNDQWFAVASELSAAVQGRREIPEISPFDATSEATFEEQKVETIYKIREAIIANEPLKALGLLRAARELWPEGDAFGSRDIEPEPEFLVLREIHLSNLTRTGCETNPLDVEASDDDDDDEEMESRSSFKEQQLDLTEVYKKFTSPKIIQSLCLLLANYQQNFPQTNICLLKLLHRIAWNCKMHCLFFQSTVFLTFQKIFSDPDVDHDPVIKELYRFAKFIMNKFFSVAEKNKKVFVEMLFWKGPREAYELEEGYGTGENRGSKQIWTEDEEEELKYLYEENKDIYIEGQDVADIILASMSKKNRTKSQIVLALKRLDLIQSIKDLKPHLRKEWQENEIMEIQHLFEEYKNSGDVMSNILENLSIKRSRKAVVDKLLEMNLIQDRKEVRKKSKKRKFGESDSGSSSEDEGELEHNPGEQFENLNMNASKSKNCINSESDEDNEINFLNLLKSERLERDNTILESTNISLNEDLINSSINVSVSENASLQKSNKKFEKLENSKNLKPRNMFPKVWDEQEIMELNKLFHENQDSDDIMCNILSALTIKRSKKNVIEKLLELGLIKDKKEIRKKRISKVASKNISSDALLRSIQEDIEDTAETNNTLNVGINDVNKETAKRKYKRRILSDSSDEENLPVGNLHSSAIQDSSVDKKKKAMKIIDTTNKTENKKPKMKRLPKVWDEQEIMELNRLFQNNQSSKDIVTDILSGLTVKRSKQNIIEKLLEVGLIKDRKEIRKKREKKAASTKSTIKNYHMQGQNSFVENDVLNESGKRPNKKKNLNYIPLQSSDDDDMPLSSMMQVTTENTDIDSEESVVDNVLISDSVKKSIATNSILDHSLTRSNEQICIAQEKALQSFEDKKSNSKESPKIYNIDIAVQAVSNVNKNILDNLSTKQNSLILSPMKHEYNLLNKIENEFHDVEIETFSKKKRKRYRYLSSDSSDENDMHTVDNMNSLPASSNKNLNSKKTLDADISLVTATEGIEQFKTIKKKLHIIDSDDSD